MHVDNIMNKIIWWNLKRFMAQSVRQTIATWGIIGFGGGIPLVAGAPLLEAPPAARMVVKCACDLILILDRAFKHGGKFVIGKDIEEASREYIAESTDQPADSTAIETKSRRKRVHAEIEELIPLRKFYKYIRIARIQRGMEDIIEKHRFGPGDSESYDLMSIMSSSTFTSSEDPEVKEFFNSEITLTTSHHAAP